MFTGIVKAVGTIAEIRPVGGDVRIRVNSTGLPFRDYETGESIAVNGVCLTAAELLDTGFAADVSKETLDVTSLGDLAPGSPVNLEPSLSLGDRLGGHLVSGHVDCVATVVARSEDARSIRLTLELPAGHARYIARKGSVCVDGVSLTVNSVSGNRFELNIIPHTARSTIAGTYSTGTRVNIEVDLLARYLERLVACAGEGEGLSMEFLEEHGYVR